MRALLVEAERVQTRVRAALAVHEETHPGLRLEAPRPRTMRRLDLVLVVDDDPQAAAYIAEIVSGEACVREARTASNLDEACAAMVDTSAVGRVVVDWRMGPTAADTAAAFVRVLRELDREARRAGGCVDVAIVSGYAVPEDQRAGWPVIAKGLCLARDLRAWLRRSPCAEEGTCTSG